MNLTENDFELLQTSAFEWKPEIWTLPPQLENYTQGKDIQDPPSPYRCMAYEFGDSYCTLLLARNFLVDKGFRPETFWLMGDFPAGGVWLLLTHYKTKTWRNKG